MSNIMRKKSGGNVIHNGHKKKKINKILGSKSNQVNWKTSTNKHFKKLRKTPEDEKTFHEHLFKLEIERRVGA